MAILICIFQDWESTSPLFNRAWEYTKHHCTFTRMSHLTLAQTDISAEPEKLILQAYVTLDCLGTVQGKYRGLTH